MSTLAPMDVTSELKLVVVVAIVVMSFSSKPFGSASTSGTV